MGSFAELFEKYGPVPILFGVLVVAIVWLAKRLNAAEERERIVRDQRVEEQKEAAVLINSASQLVQDSLGEHDRTLEKHSGVIERLIDEVRRSIPS